MPTYESAIPNPVNLIQSLRDIGYSLGTAVADIIDNSITAKATLIDIHVVFENKNSSITIVDNGIGMSAKVLSNAMLLGSFNPLAKRHKNDLGRFGLGLKTASFSQSKRLTVISKQNNTLNARSWNLELFEMGNSDKWEVIVYTESEIKNFPYYKYLGTSGTIIRWDNLDRIVDISGNRNVSDVFTEKMSDLRKHLELVYHRYLSGESGLKKVNININRTPLIPFDPFNSSKAGTPFPPETIDGIQITAFLLPHHNKITRSEYENMATQRGYLKSQGFYVYRNKRLLIYGTWFRLAPQEELTKLARVRIDLPNNIDDTWAIDIKKSRAVPPEKIKYELKRTIDKIRETSKKVYTQKGTILNVKNNSPIWKEKHSDQSVNFIINYDNPFVKDFIESLPINYKEKAYQVFRLVENYFPIDSLYSLYATSPHKLKHPDETSIDLSDYANKYFSLMKELGNSFENTTKEFPKVEPFHRYPEFVCKYLEIIKEKLNVK